MGRMLLTLNAGSSSIKFALFAAQGQGLVARARGKIEAIGTAPHLIATDANGTMLAERRWTDGVPLAHEAFLADLLDWVDDHLEGEGLAGVGHRVVHGGAHLSRPAPITPSLMDALEALCALAPLHEPHNIAAIRAVSTARPDLPQVACFDTAFHTTQPPAASRFAIPTWLEAEGVRRYGFHGLSYEYIAGRLRDLDAQLAAGRVIVAHLGSGASLCAMRNGRSIDTTMGFTALDGLIMGTRCGSIDPGVVLYLLRQKGLTANAVEHLLYTESGLLALSGLSSDMRVLLDSDDPRAQEAIEMFTYSVARHCGALASALGGVDGLVFTAGIGENAPQIRARLCRRMAWLGIELDEEANVAGRPIISAPASRVTVRVIPTDEERMIAAHMLEILDLGLG